MTSRLRLTSWAAAGLTLSEFDALEARAAELGVIVGALRGRNSLDWCVTVRQGRERMPLRGHGFLYPIICGALDDWESRVPA